MISLGVPAGANRLYVDDVFHAHRHAPQRAALAPPIERPRLPERKIRVEVLPRLHLRLALRNAVETREIVGTSGISSKR